MKSIFGIALLCCFISAAHAQMQLDSAKSSLFFVSVKNNSVGEVLTFDKLSGSVSKEGIALLEIDLVSVNTQVETRDQRMRDHLFEVSDFPVATISTQVDMPAINALRVGEELMTELKGEVNLHGEQANVFAQVLISKNASGEIRVVTVSPILVNARHFSLVEGIGILRKQAGLTVISAIVPVSFSLVFK